MLQHYPKTKNLVQVYKYRKNDKYWHFSLLRHNYVIPLIEIASLLNIYICFCIYFIRFCQVYEWLSQIPRLEACVSIRNLER